MLLIFRTGINLTSKVEKLNNLSKNTDSFKDKRKELIPDIYCQNSKNITKDSLLNFNQNQSVNVNVNLNKSSKQNTSNNHNFLKSKSKERIKSSFPSLAYGNYNNFKSQSNFLSNDNMKNTLNKRPLTNKTMSHSKFNNGISSKFNKSSSRNKFDNVEYNDQFECNNENMNSNLDDSGIKKSVNFIQINNKNMYKAFSNTQQVLQVYMSNLKKMSKDKSTNAIRFSINKDNSLGNNKITKIDYQERLKHINKMIKQDVNGDNNRNGVFFLNQKINKNNGSGPYEQLKNVR